MRKIKYLLVMGLMVPFVLFSCLDEDDVRNPTIHDMKMYMTDVEGNDSLITKATVGKSFRFVIETDADIVTVWPGGERRIMKMQDGVTDSLDMFGHPVLIASDYYSDYGLVKAKGYKTALGETGWYTSYTYKNAGDFDVTLVATNHGYQSADFKQVVREGGTVTVIAP